jgi:hypothetical protein
MNPTTRDDLARLRASLDYPESAVVPDVPTIIAAGRRARARRQVLGTVAAVVAVAVVTVVQVGPPSHPPVGAPDQAAPVAPAARADGPPPAELVAHGSARAEAPDAFDPLTRSLAVGWVPGGLNLATATVRVHEQSFIAVDGAYDDLEHGLSITVLSRGRGVDQFSTSGYGLPRGAVQHPTDPIRGSTAECLSDPLVPTCTALRWQYAPDAWAQVSYAGSAGPTPEAAAAVARRVAESVSLTVAEPVRLPFAVNERLAGLPPTGTEVQFVDDDRIDTTAGARWSVQMVYATDDPADGMAQVHVRWEPGRFVPDPGGEGTPNTTVDGHPARLSPHLENSLIVWGAQDCTWMLLTPDPVAAFGDMPRVDDPTDPAAWPPVR